MKRVEPQRIGDIIGRVFESVGASEEFMAHEAEARWADVVGPNIASATMRVHVADGVMHVTLCSASLKEQLGYMRPVLVDKINALLPKALIRDVLIH